MFRTFVIAAYQVPTSTTVRSTVQVRPSGVPPTAMPSLPEPPRHLLPELGHRALGRKSCAKQSAKKGSTTSAHADLQPFACGLTGTSVEVLEPRPCEIEGELPSWLEGDLFRNGPGVWDIETKGGQVYSLPHWYGPTQHYSSDCTENHM